MTLPDAMLSAAGKQKARAPVERMRANACCLVLRGLAIFSITGGSLYMLLQTIQTKLEERSKRASSVDRSGGLEG